MSEVGGWLILIVLGSIVGCVFLAFLIFFIVDWIRGEFKDDKTVAKISIFSILSLITGGVLGCSLGFGITNTVKSTNSEYNTLMYEIVSLERASKIHGSFFIGSGSVNSRQVYYVYKVTEQGYKLESLETSYTYIRESNDVTPGVYHWKASGETKSYYHIWCPVGTVVEQYRG